MTNKVPMTLSGIIHSISNLQTSQKGNSYLNVVVDCDDIGKHEFTFFKGFAEGIAKNYKIGEPVTVTATLAGREYTDKNGRLRYTTNLNTLSIAKAQIAQQSTVDEEEKFDDEIPF